MKFSKLADRAAPSAPSFAFSDMPARWWHVEFFLLFQSALEAFANTARAAASSLGVGCKPINDNFGRSVGIVAQVAMSV